jgi:hypothetical protein
MSRRRPSDRCRDLLTGVMSRLDYSALAPIYCDHGGAEFWQDRRDAVVELGLRWAEELLGRLPRRGSSLYVGAGVAELPALLCEVVDLERRVLATNLRTDEADVINAAMRAAGVPTGLAIEAVDAGDRAERHDHLSLVCVLDDPETFPVLSAVTYGRLHPVHLDLQRLLAERNRLVRLVETVGRALTRPGWVTTTPEEMPWLLAWAECQGRRVEVDDVSVPTAVVGDPIGFARFL